jgi:hypothetical protein
VRKKRKAVRERGSESLSAEKEKQDCWRPNLRIRRHSVSFEKVFERVRGWVHLLTGKEVEEVCLSVENVLVLCRRLHLAGGERWREGQSLRAVPVLVGWWGLQEEEEVVEERAWNLEAGERVEEVGKEEEEAVGVKAEVGVGEKVRTRREEGEAGIEVSELERA